MPENTSKEAQTKTQTQTQPTSAEQQQQGIEPRRETGRTGIARRDPFADFWSGDPFSSMRRLSDQMDRWIFGDLFGRSLWPSRAARETGGPAFWAPQIETFQRGDQFVVRADLPGLRKEDVNVEVTDAALVIQGERHEEHEENREGYYRSERSYGTFHRAVPLPEGTIAESAKASFKDGVLEVVMQAPPKEVSRGRRLEISE
jgi:HSP20 family protein